MCLDGEKKRGARKRAGEKPMFDEDTVKLRAARPHQLHP